MNNRKIKLSIFFALLFSASIFAQTRQYMSGKSDELIPLAPHSVQIEGYLGKRINQCINNRIVIQNVDTLVNIFKTRQEQFKHGYHGEFIGKWLAAAGLASTYQPNPLLAKKMQKAVDELISTKSAEGYINTYPMEDAFKVWDVWIQKYVLLGLIAQYDATDNKAYLEAARGSADYMLKMMGPGKLNIEEYGPEIHKGGVNYSILEPIVLLYLRSGEKRYLDFANYIIDCWSKPGKYSPQGARLLEKAMDGTPLVQSDFLHSYVYMSVFEGVCELYRATGEKKYIDAAIKAAEQIMQEELMIVGSVSNCEMWYGCARTQTTVLEKPIETCATATWMKLCYQLLRLTGDPRWVDQMEISLYNALLGAMMPNGEWWSYDSPINGERVPSRVQGLDISCCVSSGPRGLLITPQWAAMTSGEGELVMNLYSQGAYSFQLFDGKAVKIIQQTDYPVGGIVDMTVQPQKTSSFTLKLRIPEWSKQTVLKVNGEQVACKPGAYASVSRQWKSGDKISLELDMSGRIIPAPSGSPDQAIMRGPIVLVFDNRLVAEETRSVWLLSYPLDLDGLERSPYVAPRHNFLPAGKQGYIDLKLVDSDNKDIMMTFEVPFKVRHNTWWAPMSKNIVMCDYASAGNQWSENNYYRIWAPQPMFMGNMYAKDTWKVQSGYGKERYIVPENIKRALEKDSK